MDLYGLSISIINKCVYIFFIFSNLMKILWKNYLICDEYIFSLDNINWSVNTSENISFDLRNLIFLHFNVELLDWLKRSLKKLKRKWLKNDRFNGLILMDLIFVIYSKGGIIILHFLKLLMIIDKKAINSFVFHWTPFQLDLQASRLRHTKKQTVIYSMKSEIMSSFLTLPSPSLFIGMLC